MPSFASALQQSGAVWLQRASVATLRAVYAVHEGVAGHAPDGVHLHRSRLPPCPFPTPLPPGLRHDAHVHAPPERSLSGPHRVNGCAHWRSSRAASVCALRTTVPLVLPPPPALFTHGNLSTKPNLRPAWDAPTPALSKPSVFAPSIHARHLWLLGRAILSPPV